MSDLALITAVSLGPFASGIDDDHVTRDQEGFARPVPDQAKGQVQAASVPLSAADVLRPEGGTQRPADVIVRAASLRHADVIVMGAHTHGRLDQLLLSRVTDFTLLGVLGGTVNLPLAGPDGVAAWSRWGSVLAYAAVWTVRAGAVPLDTQPAFELRTVVLFSLIFTGLPGSPLRPAKTASG